MAFDPNDPLKTANKAPSLTTVTPTGSAENVTNYIGKTQIAAPSLTNTGITGAAQNSGPSLDKFGLSNLSDPATYSKVKPQMDKFGMSSIPPTPKSVNQFGANHSGEFHPTPPVKTPAIQKYEAYAKTTPIKGSMQGSGVDPVTGFPNNEIRPGAKTGFTFGGDGESNFKDASKSWAEKGKGQGGFSYEAEPTVSKPESMGSKMSGGKNYSFAGEKVATGYGAEVPPTGTLKGELGGLVDKVAGSKVGKALGAAGMIYDAWESRPQKFTSNATDALSGDATGALRTLYNAPQVLASALSGHLPSGYEGKNQAAGQLGKDQVLAAPRNSSDEAKLQASLMKDPSYKKMVEGLTPDQRGEEAQSMSRLAAHNASYKSEIGSNKGGLINEVTGLPMNKAALVADANGETKRSDTRDPWVEESGSAVAASEPTKEQQMATYNETQAKLKDSNYQTGGQASGLSWVAPEGATRMDSSVATDMAKTWGDGTSWATAKPQEPALPDTKEMAAYKKTMSEFPENHPMYKTAAKSLEAAVATRDHFEKLGSATADQPAPKQWQSEQTGGLTKYSTNPEYEKVNAPGAYERNMNPVSLESVNDKGVHEWRANPNHTNEYGHTAVQEKQYQHDPQRAVEKHMQSLTDAFKHERFMSGDNFSGLVHAQRAKDIGTEIGNLNTSMASERAQKHQDEYGLMGTTETANAHRYGTDALERGNIRTVGAEYDKNRIQENRDQLEHQDRKSELVSLENRDMWKNTSLLDQERIKAGAELVKNRWAAEIADGKEREGAIKNNLQRVDSLSKQAMDGLSKKEKEDGTGNEIIAGMAGALDFSSMSQPEFNRHFQEAKKQHDILKNSGSVFTSAPEWFAYTPALSARAASADEIINYNRLPGKAREEIEDEFNKKQAQAAKIRAQRGV